MTVDPDAIARCLLVRPSAALRVCAQPVEAARVLAACIWDALRRLGTNDLSMDEMVRSAATDYRLIALALHRRGALDSPDAIPDLTPVERVDRFGRRACGDGLDIVLYDERHRAELAEFLAHCGNHPASFIERQFDLPGRNAVFREGVVKAWNLPSGMPMVSKRTNRHKPGRLLQEQANIAAILQRLGSEHAVALPLGERREAPVFTISRPVCLLHDGDTDYALWLRKPGETLEELLLDPTLPSYERAIHMANYRRCLDVLFDHGIVWRDMSPRNIIVQNGQHTTYHLVDFEKVEVRPHALNSDERVRACREQFCVEEFGVICTEAELLETFEGLFAPGSWDLESTAPLPFSPRSELAAILAGRGVKQVTIGAFNRLDRLVQAVRQPRIDPASGALLRPGLLGFRVEHYLSLSPATDGADYDRKVTELLLAADARGNLPDLACRLTDLVDLLETAILLAEFEAILRYGSSRRIRYPCPAAEALCRTIDALLPAPRASDQGRG